MHYVTHVVCPARAFDWAADMITQVWEGRLWRKRAQQHPIHNTNHEPLFCRTWNTQLNLTILDATTNKLIPGSTKYIGNGEFDISYIDPVKYKAIKLFARFVGNGSNTPILHYWGVSWNATNSWRDSLFGGLKCSSKNLRFGDGEIWLQTSPTEWYRYQNNPVLKPGPSTTWDDDQVSNPCIIFNGTGFMMYMLVGMVLLGVLALPLLMMV